MSSALESFTDGGVMWCVSSKRTTRRPSSVRWDIWFWPAAAGRRWAAARTTIHRATASWMTKCRHVPNQYPPTVAHLSRDPNSLDSNGKSTEDFWNNSQQFCIISPVSLNSLSISLMLSHALCLSLSFLLFLILSVGLLVCLSRCLTLSLRESVKTMIFFFLTLVVFPFWLLSVAIQWSFPITKRAATGHEKRIWVSFRYLAFSTHIGVCNTISSSEAFFSIFYKLFFHLLLHFHSAAESNRI